MASAELQLDRLLSSSVALLRHTPQAILNSFQVSIEPVFQDFQRRAVRNGNHESIFQLLYEYVRSAPFYSLRTKLLQLLLTLNSLLPKYGLPVPKVVALLCQIVRLFMAGFKEGPQLRCALDFCTLLFEKI